MLNLIFEMIGQQSAVVLHDLSVWSLQDEVLCVLFIDVDARSCQDGNDHGFDQRALGEGTSDRPRSS